MSITGASSASINPSPAHHQSEQSLRVKDDVYWMRRALDQARMAAAAREVPVGAVVVKDDRLIGKGHNKSITKQDPTAHAEIVAMRQAAAALGNYRLTNCLLYVTLEPCAMCLGAAAHARMAAVIFALADAKGGAIVSCGCLTDTQMLSWKPVYRSGILAPEAAQLMRRFFVTKRGKRARSNSDT